MRPMKGVGIILKTLPFQDYHIIAEFFTKEWGLQRLICPYARAQRSPFLGHLLPLNQIEMEFRKTRSDLGRLENVGLLYAHENLRHSLEALQSGCEMLKAISDSQLPEKPSPLLFDLLEKYLFLLEKACFPQTLVASFKLKLLRHEGLIAEEKHKNQMSLGAYPPLFSLEEKKFIWALSMATSSSHLQQISLPESLCQKIDELFLTSIKD